MNFYRVAARILDDLSARQHGSLKSLVYNSKDKRNPNEQKRLYALLSETLKQKDILERVIESSQLLKIERKVKISKSFALVLVYDLLCSKRGIAAASGPIKDAILRHKTRLKAEYVKAQLSRKVDEETFTPRWVRVNILKITLQEFVKRLAKQSLVPVDNWVALKEHKTGYYVDVNVSNVLAFHPSYPVTETFSLEYSNGELILQNKASCIPPELLHVETGSTALDACAAPGNKTTQLAAALGPSGRIFAVEKDIPRASTLKTMVEKAGASEFTTILNADFTTLDPSDPRLTDVTYILLDPSCSGSGLDRLDYDHSDVDLPTRLRSLSIFQTRLLKHALSFPSVKRVVYSTCSIHPEENERVVSAVLIDVKGWRVLRRDEQPHGLQNWHRRGISEECPSEDIAQGCIRCDKGKDGTIGFFAVALLKHTSSSPIDTKGTDEEEEWQGLD